MNEQNTSCNGYWVKMVFVGDYYHPTTYKCMNQQEYNAYQAQIYQQQHNGDWVVIPMLLILFIFLFTPFFIFRRNHAKH